MIVDVAFFVIEFLVVLQYLNPIADLFPSFMQMIVFALWLLAISQNRKLFIKCIGTSLISLAIFVVTLIRCFIAGQINMDYFSPMQDAIARYQFFVYPTLFTYIVQLNDKKKRKLFMLSVISMTVTVLVSLYYVLFVDPQAIRNTQGVSYFGVGDFNLIYAMALFGGPYLSYIRRKHNNREKVWIHVTCLCLMSFCIIICNLVTAVVVLALSIALSLFFSSKKSILKILIVITGGVIISLRRVWARLLRSIAEKNIFYWSTNNKILAIANLISGQNYGLDTLSTRTQLTMVSLHSFLEHPLFGIDFRNHRSGVVGCHAQWADDLARYGVFGNMFIWLNYIHVAKYTLKCCHSFEMRSSMIIGWVTFVILGFLNPCLSGTILMVMFVVIPSMYAQEDGIVENECFSFEPT